MWLFYLLFRSTEDATMSVYDSRTGGLKDEETVIAEHYPGYDVIPHGMRGACCGRR